MSTEQPLHLAVALDGAGWHPAAWREPEARPAELFTPGYWVDLIREAERGLLDLVTIEDALGVQTDRTDRVQGRLDAVLIASRAAPVTEHIGLVPVATVTHTEPFHISKAIATLDHVSLGRAGWQVRVSPRSEDAALFGRREVNGDALFAEAAEYVEVVRRLWDSWEDDAEIRDAATGRFIDRAKLHYIEFDGLAFSIKGPSITPRPPQGQPLVTALAHGETALDFAAQAADLVFVTPADTDDVPRTGVRHVFADLVVILGATEAEARDARARLDERAGAAYTSDAAVFTGTPQRLADLLVAWQAAGVSGFRLRPGRLPADLTAITRGLVPELQRRGVFRREYAPGTLRDRLGLARPANRYAQGASVA